MMQLSETPRPEKFKGAVLWLVVGTLTFFVVFATTLWTTSSPAGRAIFDPIGIAAEVRPTPSVTPRVRAHPQYSRPTRLVVAGAAGGITGALTSGFANAAPSLAGRLGDAGVGGIPANVVTGFLAAAFAAVVGTVVIQIANAPAEDMPEQTRRKPGKDGKNKKQGSPQKDGAGRQLLGIRGAQDDDVPLWKIRLQLTKPVTWVPLIWGVACGAAASGNFHWWNPLTMGQPGHIPFALAGADFAKAAVAMFMSGPLLTGYTQTINDWYDREIDAINEPYRPIPSGRITEPQVIAQIWTLLLGGIAVAAGLDYWAGHWFDGVSGVALGPVLCPPIVANALFGALVAYIYSAPPLKLKQSGWIGNYALGASYIALPWWCGQSLFGELNPEVMVLSVLYSMAGLGIAIVNDFKSIEGDRQMGLMSLPVQFGIERAKWICAGTIDATQLAVALYLAYIGETNYAIALFGLVAPQIFFQFKFFLKDPLEFDVKYQGAAQPFLVFGILCTALAMGHHQQTLTALLG